MEGQGEQIGNKTAWYKGVQGKIMHIKADFKSGKIVWSEYNNRSLADPPKVGQKRLHNQSETGDKYSP